MNKNTDKIIIMNYNTGDIIICDNPPENEDTETILKNLDLNINDCAVMFSTRARITKIKYSNIK